MSDHETEQPPPEPEPQPPPEPEEQPSREPEAPAAPRRLLRARDDRIIGGVAGGLGKYFNVDPVFFRVGLVVLAFIGGLGVFLYLAALLFVPSEQADGGEPPRRSRAWTIAGAVLLVVLGGSLLFKGGWWFGGFFGPLGFLLLLGAVAWWLVWGRSRAGDGSSGAGNGNSRRTLARIAIVLLILLGSAALFVASVWTSAAEGGVAVAILVIAIGGLLAAAAFRNSARWLILPALAIAGGVGIVAAADINLDGGHGKREYTPTSLAELQSGYDLGTGSLEVDLRRVDFNGGERKLQLEVGFGEAVLVVPRDLCVVADADVGVGYLRMLDWDDGGFNVDWDQSGAARPATRLIVDAHVGMGALRIVHDPSDVRRHDGDWGGRNGWEDIHREEDPALGRSAACAA